MIIALVFLVILVVYILKYYYDVSKLPRGPFPIPMIGNLYQFNAKNPQESFTKWAKKYGPIYTAYIPLANVVIADYEALKDTLIKQGDVFVGRRRAVMNELLANGNHGLVWSDGPIWKEQRRFALHTLKDFGFGRSIMEGKIMAAIDRTTQRLQEEIDTSPGAEAIVDIGEYIVETIANVVNSVTMGYYFEHQDPKLCRIKQLLDDCFAVSKTPSFLLMDCYPWMQNIPLPGHFGYDKFAENVDEIRSFMSSEVQNHKLKIEDTALIGREPMDFTAAYLAEMKRRHEAGEDMGFFSETQLTGCLFDVWIAGLETTSTTLRWAFLYLLRDDYSRKKVYEEIEVVLGTEKRASMADRSRMPYTCAVIAETQRNANLVPLNVQHTTTDTVALGGCQLPPGTLIMPQIGCVLKDDRHFESPNQFDPSRFLDGGGNFVDSDHLVPFGLGKRQCIGKGLARMELFLVLVTFLQKFLIAVPIGHQKPSMEPVFMFTNQPQPFRISVRARRA